MTDDTPTTGPAANNGATKPPGKPVTTVTTGTLIMGTYEIEKLINSGGMGEVYRGRNIHNDELVAIKIVLPSLAHDPKIVALFQKESTVLSRLAHEAIVRYHVFTNDPTIGRPCMVMEFVSGTALSDRIEQGPMPLDEVKVMMRRVASGLDKAHRAGVVHRDLSPDNVILEEGAVEHAKLIDFGIAKSTNFGSGTLLQGQFAGKFNWVSPEQLGAYGGQVDGRSDIYSLALIIAGASRGAVLQMGASIVDAVSKRASVPDLQGVDPALVPLLSWMLEPDPAHRVESMAKVIAALDNPALVPSREPPVASAPDPNRTVIEALPVIEPAPVTSAPAAGTGSPAWEMPPTAQKSDVPPEGATIIAPQTQAPQPQEPDDASPFSSARAAAAPVVAAAAPVAKGGGKGGMMGVLALLAVAAGGAGAYFSGVLDGAKPGPDKPAEEQVAATDTPKPAEEPVKPADPATDKPAEDPAKAEAEAAAKAEADAAAAAEAQAKADAEAQAAETAAAAAKAAEETEAKAKAAADAETAAKLAAEEVRSQSGAIAAAKAMATAAQGEAEKAAADAAAADLATVQGLADAATAASDKAKAAADAASTGLAEATKAGLVAKGVETAAQGVDELLATAGADAKAATDAAAAAEAASAKAADAVRLANEAEAARLAEEKAKEDALKADPVARQQAFLDDFTPPSCVHLRLTEAKAEGFALEGFAVDTKPLETLSANWASATELTPDIAVHLINEEQCAALDFMNGHRSAPLTVKLTNAGEVVKSGSFIEGVIEGLPHQNIALFVVSGAGAATNLKDFVTMGDNGTASFKFALKLVEGQPPAPHVLLAVTADEALVTMLGKLKPGTSIGGTRGLLPFVDKQLANAGVQSQVGLGFFRLEN